jgi:ElaB/YqjD/DUF883 family membrane-anchored ribosome-binding protein
MIEAAEAGAAMAKDVLVSSELKSLQEELAASRKQRTAAPAEAKPAPQAAEAPAEEPPDQPQVQDQLRQFVNELTHLFDEAEKGISTHPTQSVIGALLVGILIGRLLGKR